MPSPGRLLASGRDADIFECGPRLVLRRSREARSMADEARTMTYAREHGYPVPAIDAISDDGTELTIERLYGPSMVDLLGRRPWQVRTQGVLLADLHRRLHDIPAPEWLARAPGVAGEQLVHLDLHPLNVMMTAHGPVVIDWSNAARGSGCTDVALTWVLVSAGQVPGGGIKSAVLARFRSLLVNGFIGQFDLAAVTPHLRGVVEWKVTDPHMSEVEQQAMWRLVEAVEGKN
jgi:aminoglycoside phosphotransferase (APT) family kinase protein